MHSRLEITSSRYQTRLTSRDNLTWLRRWLTQLGSSCRSSIRRLEAAGLKLVHRGRSMRLEICKSWISSTKLSAIFLIPRAMRHARGIRPSRDQMSELSIQTTLSINTLDPLKFWQPLSQSRNYLLRLFVNQGGRNSKLSRVTCSESTKGSEIDDPVEYCATQISPNLLLFGK